MIAMKSKIDNLSNFNYRYTHCETEYHIRYSGVVYSVSGVQPVAEKRVSDRNDETGVGYLLLNYDQRMDKTAYVLSIRLALWLIRG
jgi:hypothetical protein